MNKSLQLVSREMQYLKHTLISMAEVGVLMINHISHNYGCDHSSKCYFIIGNDNICYS